MRRQVDRARRRILMGIVALPAIGAGAVDDGLLHDRINRKLNNNPSLRIRALKVQVADGVVTIEGTVRSAKVKSRAGRMASIKGVKRVINKLVVGN